MNILRIPDIYTSQISMGKGNNSHNSLKIVIKVKVKRVNFPKNNFMGLLNSIKFETT